jgi:hypothetical protein
MRLFVLAAHTVEVCNLSDISPVFMWFIVPRFGSMSWERVGCLIFALPTQFLARHAAWESFDLFIFLRYNSLPDTGLFKLMDVILQVTTDSGVNFGTAFLGPFTNLRRARLASSCLSVRPHGTTRLPLDGFSLHFLLECFSKLCPENSGFIKIWQDYRVLYVKTYVH